MDSAVAAPINVNLWPPDSIVVADFEVDLVAFVVSFVCPEEIVVAVVTTEDCYLYLYQFGRPFVADLIAVVAERAVAHQLSTSDTLHTPTSQSQITSMIRAYTQQTYKKKKICKK